MNQAALQSSSLFLTEAGLGKLLPLVFPKCVITQGFCIERKRIDYAVWQNDNVICLVEFDGFRHYQNYATIQRDALVKLACERQGIWFVQIPYFVQPDNQMLKWWFGKHLQPFTNYSHGFVDSKALRPSDFSIFGLRRFANELQLLPKRVSNAIKQTMTESDLEALVSIRG